MDSGPQSSGGPFIKCVDGASELSKGKETGVFIHRLPSITTARILLRLHFLVLLVTKNTLEAR